MCSKSELCGVVQLLVVQLQAERQTLYVEALNAFKRVSCFELCSSVTAGRETGLVLEGPECVQRVRVVLSCAVLCCVVV